MKSIISSLFLICSQAFAGGSISFLEEVKPILEDAQAPEVLRLLDSIDVEDAGEAVRLGRYTMLAGVRVCPCVFGVRTKGPLAIPGRLEVRTRWHVMNSRGREVGIEDPSATSIRQVFTGMSLELENAVLNDPRL